MEYKATWKDGKLHGLRTRFYENGQKYLETTYKDGKLISSKGWDKDGKLISSKGWDKDGNPK
jgi:antitoxin component YwqK of YwqJK toxin-antitoxin module